MGIRFISNTWRAPLQLIDCWLPLPTSLADIRTPTLPRILQRFARAGWLGRHAGNSLGVPLCLTKTVRPGAGIGQRPRHVRVHRSPDASLLGRAPDGRLALSGRINDVCAELDRLAALEISEHSRPQMR